MLQCHLYYNIKLSLQLYLLQNEASPLTKEGRSKRMDIQGQIPAKTLIIQFHLHLLTNKQWLVDFKILYISSIFTANTFHEADLPSYPHLAGFFRIFLVLPHPDRIFEIRLPSCIFWNMLQFFCLRSLFFLKTYNIFWRSTFKSGYFQSFLAFLSCVVARSLNYRLAHLNCLNHQDRTVPKNR